MFIFINNYKNRRALRKLKIGAQSKFYQSSLKNFALHQCSFWKIGTIKRNSVDRTHHGQPRAACGQRPLSPRFKIQRVRSDPPTTHACVQPCVTRRARAARSSTTPLPASVRQCKTWWRTSTRTEPGLWWVAVGCGGLRWVAVGCGGLRWVSGSFSEFQ